MKLAHITRVMEGYDMDLLNEGLLNLVGELELDALLLDTHPGLYRETLLSIAMSEVLAIIMRPDEHDQVDLDAFVLPEGLLQVVDQRSRQLAAPSQIVTVLTGSRQLAESVVEAWGREACS